MKRLWKTLWILFMLAAVLGCDDQNSKYEFFFMENGGNDIPGYWVLRSEWDGTLPLPVREGYYFDGWYLDEDFETRATKASVDEQNIYGVELYAHWINADQDVVLEHWVTDFDGEFILFQTQTIGGIFGETAHAVAMNDPGFTEITDHPSRVPTVTVLAEGTPALKLYYSRNTVTVTYYYRPGIATVQVTGLAYSPLPLRTEGTQHDHHAFDGWYYDLGGQWPFTSTVMPGSDTTLVAHWTFRPVTVTLVNNGGSGSNTLQGIPFTQMPLSNPIREGYAFFGWFYDADCLLPYEGIDLPMNPDQTVYPWEDLTLYAKWIGNDSIVSTYHWYENENGEYVHGHTTTQIVPYGELATATPNTDYFHLHVYLDDHPNQVLSGTPQPDQPVTLHLYYERMTFQLTVEHGFNGATTVVDVKYGSRIFPYLPIVSREGYSFQGVQYAGTANWLNVQSKMTAYDLTIRMVWAELWFKTIFVSNAEAAIPSTSDKFGTEYSLPTPTRLGHTFLGWFYDEALTIECPMTGTVLAADRTLYAKWTPVIVTVAFVTNAETAIDPLQVAYLSSYALPSPEKAGFLFGGWYRDAALTEKFVQTPQMTDLTLTLYAKWLNMTTMIHFDTMGGPYVEDLFQAPGSPLTLPVPERPGFEFLGWFDAMLTTPFEGTVMPEENLVLYAKWRLLP